MMRVYAADPSVAAREIAALRRRGIDAQPGLPERHDEAMASLKRLETYAETLEMERGIGTIVGCRADADAIG